MLNYIYVGFGCFVIGLSLGVYLNHEIHLAGQTVAESKMVTQAQQGETQIIAKTQTLNKAIRDDKDKCLDAPIAPAVLGQLR
jgi:hypothetical protein